MMCPAGKRAKGASCLLSVHSSKATIRWLGKTFHFQNYSNWSPQFENTWSVVERRGDATQW